MKKTVKWILLALLLAGVIAGAALLYHWLGDRYRPENLMGASSSPDSSSSESANPAPDFTVQDQEGGEVKLSDYRGKPVVLNFWATWCYYCKEEMPEFQKAYEKYPEVQFLMVNATDGVQESKAAAKDYISWEGFSFDVFFDTRLEATNAYYITGLPATFFIDSKGNLVASSNGALDLKTLEEGIGMILE